LRDMNLDTKDQRVCSECVDDEFLRTKIEEDGHDAACFYCARDGRTFSVDQMADLVRSALPELFDRIDLNPPDDAGGWHSKGQPVADVLNGAGIGYLATEDILRVLAERHRMEQGEIGSEANPFDDKARYVRKDSVDAWDFEGDWFDFERSLKTEARYFNRRAEATLASIFDGIDGHRTIGGRPIVAEAGPGTELAVLYRARVFHSEKRPDQEIGPPPASFAAAGRMNAAGIAVFYGATDPSVALAEVRPPVGSKVLIGCFEVIRRLSLLDLEALEAIVSERGSIFDADYIRRLKQAEFLRGLSKRFSKPVMPDDQPRDYLRTQAVADFLATMDDPPLDGIIYPSVQIGYLRPRRILAPGADKRNVVLFHKSARVQCLDIPEGSEISVSDDSFWPPLFGYSDDYAGSLIDAPEAKYAVTEKVPKAAPPADSDDAHLKFSSLEVHFVNGVTLSTRSSQVLRHREQP
jgi:hypothetical protein